jgi:hypothetical protein
MTGLDYLAFVVLSVLVGAGLYLAFVLGALPGRIAAQRNHPQADAVCVAGWLGLLTLGLLWPIALIWAYIRPRSDQELSALRDEVALLDERMGDLEQGRSAARKRGEGS